MSAHNQEEKPNPFTQHPGDVQDPSNPSTSHVDAARRAHFILEFKRRPFPSLKSMKEDAEKPDGLEMFKQRVAEVKSQYADDLAALQRLHGEEYHEDALDKFLSKDESQYLVPSENNPTAVAAYKAMEALYNSRSQYVLNTKFADDRERLDHTYLHTLLPLEGQVARITKRDEEMRREKAKRFPGTVAEFRALDSETQLRVATYLTSDPLKQENMRAQYGWVWRQTQALVDMCGTDGGFMIEVKAAARKQ
ncbi:hypothetical protein PC9H_006366 [Pleurotus ostreatus]|uniref:Uncharacterized protein n=1 Tax=Pleurotus ostreatus TaxID=5322 RepID=A0A8H6ZXH1_PLEOS|nr:uncharacterized protein PC9H_006366 [Pleurotus ostreatus]KAF7430657.1 hypothetical protein PC9H_006366 [Pleurotus ostreatus]KAJ8694978.1 hypothetical protein PTI98_007608 [Pleurotus ostreatus]